MKQLFQQLLMEDKGIHLLLRRRVQSKQRARVSANGHVYTPEATRTYEAYVRASARTLNVTAYTCPVKILIVITELIPKSYKGWKREAAELGLISPPVGDLDNKVKAITDGLNGIAYLDDRQINAIRAERQYGDEQLLEVTITRSGLSLSEIENYERNKKSSARVGKEGRSRFSLRHEQSATNSQRPSRRDHRSRSD